MAGLSDTRVIESLFTTTQDNFRKILVDNIFDVSPFLSWLNGKLGVALRGSTVKRMEDGGARIVEHLLFEQNSTVNSYAGAETLDTTLQEGLTQAIYEWKQYAATTGITGKERRQNQGSETRLLNLLQSKLTQTEMSMRDRFSVDSFADGTGNGSKNINGLEAIVSATSTLGGLAPATFAWWKATVTASGSFAGQGLADMRTLYNTLSFGSDRPDFLVTTQAVFEFFEKSLQPQERYTNTTTANSGFQNLMFKAVPLVFDRDCTSGVLYMLNSKYLSWVVHPDADMSTTPFQTPINQDVTSSQLLFMGNMTTNQRRKLGKLTGIVA